MRFFKCEVRVDPWSTFHSDGAEGQQQVRSDPPPLQVDLTDSEWLELLLSQDFDVGMDGLQTAVGLNGHSRCVCN